MAEGVQLSRELAEVLKEMAKKYLAYGWPTQVDRQDRYFPPDSIIFVNRSGEEIPPYGCMQVTGTLESDGRTIFEVSKPDAATLVSDNQLLFNSARAVPDDENGIAQPPAIVKAIKDSAETTDDIGEGWSYTDGQWYLSPTGGSFVYYGTSDIDDDVIIVKCPSGGGAAVKYFRLQEDAATTRLIIYAKELDDDGSLIGDHVGVYDRFNWLAVARVNQDVMAIWDGSKSRWAYVPGSCVTFNSANNQSAAITSTYTPGGGVPQDAPDGTVGVSYSHTISSTQINTPTVADLPGGISSSWNSGTGVITLSGTPTTAGEYFVKITATATGSGTPGTRTRLVRILVT